MSANYACRCDVTAIYTPRGELADFEEWRTDLEQLRQPLPR